MNDSLQIGKFYTSKDFQYIVSRHERIVIYWYSIYCELLAQLVLELLYDHLLLFYHNNLQVMFTRTIQLTNIVCCYDAIRLHLEYFKGLSYTSTHRGIHL